MSSSLEQAVAQWLTAFPHGANCHRTHVADFEAKYGRDPSRNRGETPTCTCDREQRIAARVAAATHSLAWSYADCVEEEWGVGDPADKQALCAEYEAEFVRALTHPEEPR